MSIRIESVRRFRHVLLALAIVCWLAGLVFAFGPVLDLGEYGLGGLLGTLFMLPGLDPFDSGLQFCINTLFILGGLLVAQWMFLRPRAGWTPTLTHTGRPMRSAVAAAAVMAMLITVAGLATALEMLDLWKSLYDRLALGGMWIAMFIVWAVWAGVFFIYWRQGDRYTQLGRMVRGLMAGSFLALLVAAPVQMWSPRRKDCYCATGSYTGLVFAGTVMLWCFGPGLVLLFLHEKYRREKLASGSGVTCSRCGYDLTGTLAAEHKTCPECGEPIPSAS